MSDLTLSMSEFASALKIFYGGTVPNQINTELGPLVARIAKTTKNVVGGEYVEKLAPFGISGNAAAFSEGGALPYTSKQTKARFRSYLKNQAARALFTEKVLKVSRGSAAAFADAATDSMDNMKESGKIDYARQLYLDGTGLCTTCGVTDDATTVVVTSTQYLMDGMVIDIVVTSTGVAITNGRGRKIAAIIDDTSFLLEGTDKVTTAGTHSVTNQGAFGLELTGLNAVLAQTGSIYNLARASYPALNAKVWNGSGSGVGDIDDAIIMKAIKDRASKKGAKIDLLIAHPDVVVTYGDYLSSMKQTATPLTLEGGWTAISCGGIPMIDDRFSKKQSIRGLETKNFYEHMLHDWEFLEDGMFRLVPGTANYEVTMTKYSELICDKPGANFSIDGITVL